MVTRVNKNIQNQRLLMYKYCYIDTIIFTSYLIWHTGRIWNWYIASRDGFERFKNRLKILCTGGWLCLKFAWTRRSGRKYNRIFLAGLLRAALLPTTSGLSKPFFLSWRQGADGAIFPLNTAVMSRHGEDIGDRHKMEPLPVYGTGSFLSLNSKENLISKHVHWMARMYEQKGGPTSRQNLWKVQPASTMPS